MTAQGKPDRCPAGCGSTQRIVSWCIAKHNDIAGLHRPATADCIVCRDPWHSSPVPAAAPTSVQVTRIEEIAGDLAAAIYEVQQGTDEMAIKTLLLDFAKEIQRASIEPTGF